MVNAEKYRVLIIEIFKTEGMNIGILNNTPYDFRKRVIELIKLAEVW